MGQCWPSPPLLLPPLTRCLPPPQAMRGLGLLLDFSSVCGHLLLHSRHGSPARCSVADSASSQYGSSPATPVLASPRSSVGLPFHEEQEREQAQEQASVMSDDSAQQQPDLEEGDADTQAQADAPAEQHPWLTSRWRQHVKGTASGLLRLAVQQGCPATAGWLLQLLQDLGGAEQEVACQVGNKPPAS
jgi:hypothetical protein